MLDDDDLDLVRVAAEPRPYRRYLDGVAGGRPGDQPAVDPLDLDPLSCVDLAAPLEGAVRLVAELKTEAVLAGMDAAAGQSGQGDCDNDGGQHTGHVASFITCSTWKSSFNLTP
jgi:hypothetical protein